MEQHLGDEYMLCHLHELSMSGVELLNHHFLWTSLPPSQSWILLKCTLLENPDVIQIQVDMGELLKISVQNILHLPVYNRSFFERTVSLLFEKLSMKSKYHLRFHELRIFV